MSNFKRKGKKSTRSGCLLCKPHKAQGNCEHALKPADRKELERAVDMLVRDYGDTLRKLADE